MALAQGSAFRGIQVSPPSAGRAIYRRFVCYEARLVIELDGSQHAESSRDKARDGWLATGGYRVLRFWNNDVSHKKSGAMDAIWTALQEARQ